MPWLDLEQQPSHPSLRNFPLTHCLTHSGLWCRWAADWRRSLSKHSLYSLAFSLSLTRGVCLSARRITTPKSLALLCIQSLSETESRWEAGLSCQTSHQKATFCVHVVHVVSRTRLCMTLSLVHPHCRSLWCRHRKWFVIVRRDDSGVSSSWPFSCYFRETRTAVSPSSFCSGFAESYLALKRITIWEEQ